jgi:two-component system phosphate regulon response regulator PhoB
MNNILIIEDELDLRNIIKFNLEQCGFGIQESSNANDALILMEDFLPDLILLDLMLPGLKGENFLTLIKKNEKFKEIPVIIISAKNREEDIVKAIENGAHDYLVKPFSLKVLIAKINSIIKRNLGYFDSITEYEGIRIDERNYKIFLDDQELELTHKEYLLLSFFVKHPKQVFTRNQLLSNVWGYESDVYTRTVDSHISSLRKKLGTKGQLIRSIQKIGYKLE